MNHSATMKRSATTGYRLRRTMRFTAERLREYWEGVILHRQLEKRERVRRPQIAKYFEEHTIRKLHMGAGKNCLSGWLNTDRNPRSVDVVSVDITEPFPFPDGSFDYAFSEHLIEHLPYSEGQKAFRECHRVLRTDGTLRIATPNLLNLIGLFNRNRSPATSRYLEWALNFNELPTCGIDECFVLNHFVRAWGHAFIYDPGTLKVALESAGFKDVILRQPGESSDPQLAGIELHGNEIGEEYNRFETMVIEAKR